MGASTEQLMYVPVTGGAAPEPDPAPEAEAPAGPSWLPRGKLGTLGALVLFAAAVVALSSLSLCNSRGTVIAAAPEALSEQKGAEGKKEEGSWFQTSCLATGACKCPGQVCYRKNKFWAMCMESCDKDVPEVDDKGKKHFWNCSELGPRTPAAPADGKCAGSNADCRSSRCCQGKGMQCYAKNEYWATCKASCKKGVDPKDADGSPWGCEELGPRTPGSPFEEPGTQDVSQCAWDKGNCAFSRCCKVQGSTCYRKDNTWATCEKSCAKQPAMGGPWTCEVIGGAPSLPEPLAPAPGQGTALSLFCFTVVMPTTFEVGLVGTQRAKKAGIFECDASAVFQGADAPEGKSIKLVAIPKVFQSIWEEVKKDGQYLSYDWTVKVDPDVVFLPTRLKEHLQKLNAPPTPGIYVKNTYAGYGFNGAVQVYSKGAMQKYFMHHKECSKNMITQAEDVYMMTCLDAAGARYMRDDLILNDQTTFQFASDMKDLSYCADVRFAAYHPYKDADTWMRCRDRSTKAVKKCPKIDR